MIYHNVRHAVADYAKWRVGFDANEAARRAAGATGVQQAYRDLENPSTITIIMEWDNADKARQFAHDPALAEAMKNAGVTSAPEIRFLNRA